MTGLRMENFVLPEPLAGKTGWPWTDSSESLPDKLPDGSPWPKISVVIPSFNQGQFIEETIRSVLFQGYPNLEIIIIDGGSTDDTLVIIKKYETWLTYWVSEPDRGQGHAINKGIQIATGEILLWLNSDDIVLPGAFQIAAQHFTINPEIAIVTGQAKVLDTQDNFIGELKSSFIDWEECATNPGNSLRQISSFIKRKVILQEGLIDEELDISMDRELMVRLTKHNLPVIIQDYIAAFRVHDESKTSMNLLGGYKENDCISLSILENKFLRNKYRKRSSSHWICLSETDKYSKFERVFCLIHAFRILPQSIFTKNYWSSLMTLFRELM